VKMALLSANDIPQFISMPALTTFFARCQPSRSIYWWLLAAVSMG
jgi:hypothetical protein